MSLNFGNEFANLAFSLRDNEQFARLRIELGKAANKLMNKAIDAPPEARIEQTAYARAVRDLFVIFEASARKVPAQQVTLPELPHIEEDEELPEVMLAPSALPVPPNDPDHPLARGRRSFASKPPRAPVDEILS